MRFLWSLWTQWFIYSRKESGGTTMTGAETGPAFSTGQLPNLRAQWPDKRVWQTLSWGAVVFGAAGPGHSFDLRFFLSRSGRFPPDASASAKARKRLAEWAHQSVWVFSLGGTKAAHQANHQERRRGHSWTTHSHKGRGPPLCLWADALL